MNHEELMDEDTPKHSKVLTMQMKEMDLKDALRLFSIYAFKMDYPPVDNLDLSVMGQLPLALEIIGSQLCGKRKEEWEDKLSAISRIPHENIQKKQMISYEALDYRTKQIFLDIACLPVLMEKA
ncbi:disease resistance protein RML1B-like [Punica granatum]|uniref:Disease resistance protein RML1B-like n=1 Tax=Punica granatum TaxID=22663 RepID=A0A6P8D7S5_PUNGR|nr:disease resistance protein RML1B-like [Punica granatum]